MDDKMFDELCESIREAGDIRALLRVARAADNWYKTRQWKGAGTEPEFRAATKTYETLEALPPHLRDG